MTEPDPDLTADGEPVGWRVIDPDGNVVDSGPGMFLIAVGDSGPAEEQTPATASTEEN